MAAFVDLVLIYALVMAIDVIDMGLGNIGSVQRLLQRVGLESNLVREPRELTGRAPLLLPGVGHFTQAAQFLDSSGFRAPLRARMEAGHPMLGICLGAQLFCCESEEGPGVGLGWVPSTVRRFPTHDVAGKPLRVPHMGWRRFAPPEDTLPFHVPPGRMYFAHSFFIDPRPSPEHVVCTGMFGGHEFASVVRSNDAIGLQFHPEKSLHFGSSLVRAWADWASGRIGVHRS
ncbi:MAG: imidazole glycerol phosphate synthase subunit HisH [Phycisphaerales bacterium]